MRIIQLFVLTTFLISGFIGCEITVTEPAPTVGSIKFVNKVEQELVGVNTIKYSIRNISTLNQSWQETISFGSTSETKEVSVHTGTLVISGEIKSSVDSEWTAGTWNIDQNIVAGETATIFLELEEE
ncbi:MAG: hypothetical protein OCD01_15100 [Fibrobacterales bacterium]